MRWAETLPEGSPAKSLHLPLFHFLTTSLNYEDTFLVADLARGMRIAGVIERTNVLVDRPRPARIAHSEWLRPIPSRNKKNSERTQRAQGTRLARECWERTLEEVQRGWASTPEPVTDHSMETLPLTPRFAREEQHGSNNAKIRMVDDFRASGVKGLAASMDTDVPDTLDSALSIASLFEEPQPGVELQAFAADFRHAYKNIPIATDQQDYAAILLPPPSGPPMMARIRTQHSLSALRGGRLIGHAPQRSYGG